MLTIEARDYQIMDAAGVSSSPSLPIETVDILALIDDHRGGCEVESRLEWAAGAIDKALSADGWRCRVIGGYVAGSGVIFSLSDDTFPGAAVRDAIARALACRGVKAFPGGLIVTW
jgi:hypothetical protein